MREANKSPYFLTKIFHLNYWWENLLSVPGANCEDGSLGTLLQGRKKLCWFKSLSISCPTHSTALSLEFAVEYLSGMVIYWFQSL